MRKSEQLLNRTGEVAGVGGWELKLLTDGLGLTKTPFGATPAKEASSSIPRIVASPDIPLRVRPRLTASLITSVRPTARQLWLHCLQPRYVSFVTMMPITR